MPDTSDLAELSFPIVDGRWHGEAERLQDLEAQVMINRPLASWAYYEAGRDLEQIRTKRGYIPSWLYPQGDRRLAYMMMRALALPPVPTLDVRDMGRGAPPMKAAPQQLGDATRATADRNARQAEADAARRQAARGAAIAQADAVAREKDRRFQDLRRQQYMLDEAHEQKLRNNRAATLRADYERQAANQVANALLLAKQDAVRREIAAEEERRTRESQEAEAIEAQRQEDERLAWQQYERDRHAEHIRFQAAAEAANAAAAEAAKRKAEAEAAEATRLQEQNRLAALAEKRTG